MAIRHINRKQAKRVTIAHISDLHFTPDTPFPDETGGSHLKALISDIREKEPDILVVTGDLADNPLRDRLVELMADLGGDEIDRFNERLPKTFSRVREFLDRACRQCGVDPGNGLFVVPGNHDYRLQGFYSGGWWGRKYTAEAVRSSFTDIFRDCYGSDEAFTLACHHPTDRSDVVLRIVCLDSNGTDAYLNFATGAVSQAELGKVDLLGNEEELTPELKKAVQFRVCLVHHHPLPVVTAEAFRELPPAGLIEKARNLITTLTGEQTNMFKNGGTFLLKCLENRVDLVLHGHQHRAWFSNIQYPATSVRRLLVSGAASIGQSEAGAYRYCVYSLDVGGNIRVVERTTAKNPIWYSSPTSFSVYEYGEMRSIRWERIVEQLEGEEVPGLASKYGVAEAQESVRVTRIEDDGNAFMTRTYRELIPRGQDTLASLPFMTLSTQGFVGVEPPQVRILDGKNYYTEVKWEVSASRPGGLGGSIGRLTFVPALHKDKPLSLEITFLLCNAFEFVEEYRRAVPNAAGSLEHSMTSFRSIYPRVAKDIVLFPPKLGPKQRPVIHVSKKGALEPDDAETEFCENALSVVEEPGIVSLVVRKPLPDFDYKISWHLRSEREFNEICYSTAGVEAYRKLAQPRPPHVHAKGELIRALASVKAAFATIIDEMTRVSLHVAVVSTSGFGTDRVVRRELQPFATLDTEGGLALEVERSFLPGAGVAGQAFRAGQPILFRKQGQDGSRFYLRVEEQEQIHSVLYCVPLPVISAERADDVAVASAVPVYAVLTLSTFSEESGLLTLNTSNVSSLLPLTDVIQGALNNDIQRILGSVR